MKKENKKFLNESITLLKLFGVKEREIVITGSIALDICGMLPPSHMVHDFDCFIMTSKERIKELRNNFIWLINKCDGEIISNQKYEKDETNCLFFKIFDREFNIWFYVGDAINFDIIYNGFNGIKVNSPIDIIHQKLKYKRIKDYNDILGIINMMLTNNFLAKSNQ